MFQFSVTSHGSSLRKRPIYCDRGLVTPLKTSWIDENPRCRFFGYALCEVILWLHIIWGGIIICWFYVISFSVILDLFTLSFSIFQVWGTKECSFFDWVDDEMTPRAKEVKLSFMRKVTNLKNIVARLNEAKKNEKRMNMKLKMMWGFKTAICGTTQHIKSIIKHYFTTLTMTSILDNTILPYYSNQANAAEKGQRQSYVHFYVLGVLLRPWRGVHSFTFGLPGVPHCRH